jgi:hypothetical protein
MQVLPIPEPSVPAKFGVVKPSGDLLPWSWAEERLISAPIYWIATTRPDGKPHSRPVSGVWLATGFWFSTGSRTRTNLRRNTAITVHIGGHEIVIIEGTAATETGGDDLHEMCDAFSQKYGYRMEPTEDGVSVRHGVAVPAFRVCPKVVFGWDEQWKSPTRWMFHR